MADSEFDAIARDVLDDVARVMADFAAGVADDVRASFGTSDRPSDPGGPPNDHTGKLAASLTAETAGEGEGVVGVVSTDFPAAEFLEEGTDRMAARPFMGPALERAADRIEDYFATNLKT